MYQGGGEKDDDEAERETNNGGRNGACRGERRLRFRKMNRETAFKARRIQRGCPRGWRWMAKRLPFTLSSIGHMAAETWGCTAWMRLVLREVRMFFRLSSVPRICKASRDAVVQTHDIMHYVAVSLVSTCSISTIRLPRCTYETFK